jgi:hypothetical protein
MVAMVAMVAMAASRTLSSMVKQRLQVICQHLELGAQY